MPSANTVEIRGKKVKVPNGTKADIARALLSEGYSVNEVSKAIPAAYSQVLAISKKATPTKTSEPWSKVRERKGAPKRAAALTQQSLEDIAQAIPTARQKDKARKGKKAVKPNRVGKLRIGNLPQDIGCGECANCGEDVVVRPGPNGYLFVHVNITPEEYLTVVQFCHAVPQMLIPIE